MNITELFTHTWRQAPADAVLTSHQLALRAGVVRPLETALYAWPPLGRRVLARLSAAIRRELGALGAQELRLPLSMGPRAAAMTLAAHEITSHKQLPQRVYVLQPLPQPGRPRGGLFTPREAQRLMACTLATDEAARDVLYAEMCAAFRRLTDALEIAPTWAQTAEGDVLLWPHERGALRYAACTRCDYRATAETARFALPPAPQTPTETLRKVATPNCKTIAEVADFLGVTTSQTLKAVFFAHKPTAEAAERLIFAVVRGDLEVSTAKLLRVLGGGQLEPASEDAIRAVGAEPGYASPIGLPEDVQVIADPSVQVGANFVAGANEAGYHLVGVNVPRDFAPGQIADIAEMFDGARCPQCGAPLRVAAGFELGRCSRLGPRPNVTYQDADGVERPIARGRYTLALDALIAAVIEAHHDEWGILWPRALAPFDVHIVAVGGGAVRQAARALHDELNAAGFAVLLDDRNESAGVKFNDADLLGVPLRLTVGKKALAQDAVEFKRRAERERVLVPRAELLEMLRAERVSP